MKTHPRRRCRSSAPERAQLGRDASGRVLQQQRRVARRQAGQVHARQQRLQLDEPLRNALLCNMSHVLSHASDVSQHGHKI